MVDRSQASESKSERADRPSGPKARTMRPLCDVEDELVGYLPDSSRKKRANAKHHGIARRTSLEQVNTYPVLMRVLGSTLHISFSPSRRKDYNAHGRRRAFVARPAQTVDEQPFFCL
jgi:hypothetical protein